MGKTVGGTRTTDLGGADIGRIENVRRINDIENDTLRNAVNQAVLAFQTNYGLPTKELYLATFDGAYGVYFSDHTIYLNDKYFNNNPDSLLRRKAREYANLSKIPTKKPLQHTMIHELGHSLWSTIRPRTGPKVRRFESELSKLYRQYRKEVSRGRLPLGDYATANIDEFFAEAITGSIIGRKQNKYTRTVRRLVKRYL